MPQPSLIADPDLITAEWLSSILNHAGVDCQVTGFTSTTIGTGQVGENVRFSLQGSGNLPNSVVGKFASRDPVSKQTGIAQLNYRREVFFYQHLQDKVDIQTPRIYFTAIDDATHDFVIMMEDLAPGEQGDQLGGCDADTAALAMEQLALLQGPCWNGKNLPKSELLSENRADGGAMMKALYDMVSPGFLDRYGHRLTTDEKNMVQSVGENMMNYVAGAPNAISLIHIDYRLDNMMFGGPYPITVVDWQSLALGCPLNDAAYFLGTSMVETDRRAHEKELLKLYHDGLNRYDVSLTFEDCWHYYRHYAPAGLVMAVIASMIVGETERGNDMFMVMAKRSASMCYDHNSIDVIQNG